MTDGSGKSLPELVTIMRRLLGSDGCPWDREQSFETLRPYVIEEAFEVADAIDRKSPDAIREELGDLLLQIVFQSELARAQGWFHMDDVVEAICTKLVRRHPHVFGDVVVDGADEALRNWERLKKSEKGGKGALDGVPVALPALLRAVRVGEKASNVGYDWPDLGGVRAKVDEELRELDEAVAQGDRVRTEEELGDLLFALASFARKQTVDPEAALRRALDKFTRRFQQVEKIARERGVALDKLSVAELDALWAEAKAGP